jgi:hypothetical protein
MILSREAAAEISARPIAAAASRLTTLLSFTFCQSEARVLKLRI